MARGISPLSNHAIRTLEGDNAIPINRDGSVPSSDTVANIKRAPTSQYTEFFRPGVAPDLITFAQTIAPEIQQRTGRAVRIGQIACAGGQETWTLAALLKKQGVTCDITGFDISQDMLYYANRAEYRNFDHKAHAAACQADVATLFVHDMWQEGYTRPAASLREGVQFKHHDILAGPLPDGPYDVVLAYNLLYHYANGARDTIVKHAIQSMAEGGVFMFDGNLKLPLEPTYAAWANQLETTLGLPHVEGVSSKKGGIRRYMPSAQIPTAFAIESTQPTVVADQNGESILQQLGCQVRATLDTLPFDDLQETKNRLGNVQNALATTFAEADPTAQAAIDIALVTLHNATSRITTGNDELQQYINDII